MGMPGVCESALPQDIQSTSTLLIFSVKSKYYPSHKGLLCAAALSSSGLDALLQSHIAVLPTHRFCTPASSQLLCSALYKQLLRALGAGCWAASVPAGHMWGEGPAGPGLLWKGKGWKCSRLSPVNVEYKFAACPQSHLETTELCLFLAWQCCLTQTSCSEQLCDPQPGPLHKPLAFLPRESDDPFFTYFLDAGDSLPGCQVVVALSNSGARFLRCGTPGCSSLLTPSWNACFGIPALGCAYIAAPFLLQGCHHTLLLRN